MAHVNKEGYERKREYAARRMKENANISTLTEKQHEILAEIAKMRHEIHCNQDSLYNTESGNYSEYFDWLNGLDNSINDKLRSAGLEPIKWGVCLDDLPSDIDRYEGIISNDDEAEEENREKFYGMMATINSDMEIYLLQIDKKHGTDYCPSGTTRK